MQQASTGCSQRSRTWPQSVQSAWQQRSWCTHHCQSSPQQPLYDTGIISKCLVRSASLRLTSGNITVAPPLGRPEVAVVNDGVTAVVLDACHHQRSSPIWQSMTYGNVGNPRADACAVARRGGRGGRRSRTVRGRTGRGRCRDCGRARAGRDGHRLRAGGRDAALPDRVLDRSVESVVRCGIKGLSGVCANYRRLWRDIPYACEASQSMTPPKDEYWLRVWRARLASVDAST